MKKKTISVAVSSLLGRKHDTRFTLQEEDALSAAVEVGSVASNTVSFLIAIGDGIFIAYWSPVMD